MMKMRRTMKVKVAKAKMRERVKRESVKPCARAQFTWHWSRFCQTLHLGFLISMRRRIVR